MIPMDTWLVFEGWSRANSIEETGPGADAPNRKEYKELVRKVDAKH